MTPQEAHASLNTIVKQFEIGPNKKGVLERDDVARHAAHVERIFVNFVTISPMATIIIDAVQATVQEDANQSTEHFWAIILGEVFKQHERLKELGNLPKDVAKKILEGILFDALEKLSNEKEREVVALDELTGLPRLPHTIRAAENILKKTSHTVAIFMLDLNDFKAMNEVFGHRAGNFVLAELGQRLQGFVKYYLEKYNSKLDVIAGRYGGDEFVLVLELEDVDEAHLQQNIIAEITTALHELIHKKPIKIPGGILFKEFKEGVEYPLSGSVGRFEANVGMKLEDSLKEADQDLKNKKHALHKGITRAEREAEVQRVLRANALAQQTRRTSLTI